MLWVIIILCILGVLLVGVEAIVPGGILGIAGWLAIGISAWVCFSTYGTEAGVAYLVGTALGAMVLWFLGFKFVLPKMALKPYESAGGDAPGAKDSRIGREAVVIEDLDPTGYVRLDGTRVAAHSESSFEEVGVGRKVTVVATDGMYLVCRPLEEAEEAGDAATREGGE